MDTLAFMGFNSHSTFFAPSVFDALTDGRLAHAQSRTPITQTFGNAMSGQPSIDSCIARLFTISSPSNIANLVMPIIVDAVKRVLEARSTSKICEKFFVRIKTKFNTTPAVPIVGMIIGIMTALFSCAIYMIFRRIARRTRFSVSQGSLACVRRLKASARLSFARSKMFGGNRLSVATVTQTFPIFIFRDVDTYKFQHSQPIESLSC